MDTYRTILTEMFQNFVNDFMEKIEVNSSDLWIPKRQIQ